MKLMIMLVFSLLIISGCGITDSGSTSNSSSSTSSNNDDNGGNGSDFTKKSPEKERIDKFNQIMSIIDECFKKEEEFQKLKTYISSLDCIFLEEEQKDELKNAIINTKILKKENTNYTYLSTILNKYDTLDALLKDNAAAENKPTKSGVEPAAGEATKNDTDKKPAQSKKQNKPIKPQAESVKDKEPFDLFASTKTAKEVVDTLVNPDDIIDPSLLYEVQTYLKGENKATRALELIDAGLLGKVFDSASFVDEMGLPSTINSLGIINELLKVNNIELNNKIIKEIKDNKYIEKLTVDDDTKAVFFELLPNYIKNDNEIKKQMGYTPALYTLLSDKALDNTKVTHFLNLNSKNNAEKEELAKKLIDGGIIQSALIKYQPEIITTLGLNNDLQKLVIKDITEKQYLTNLNISDDAIEGFITMTFNQLPDWLLEEQSIRLWIGKIFSPLLSKHFDAIYNTLNSYSKILKFNIKKPILTALLGYKGEIDADKINKLATLMEDLYTIENIVSSINFFKNSNNKNINILYKALLSKVVKNYDANNQKHIDIKDQIKEHVQYCWDSLITADKKATETFINASTKLQDWGLLAK